MRSFVEKQRLLKEKAAQEAIYAATVRLITEQSGDGLTMQDIAAAAGIATGTLYNYFKNKVELLSFVDRKLHLLILGRMQAIVEATQSPNEKLRQMIVTLLDFCQEHHRVFDLADKLGVKDHISLAEKTANLAQGCRCFERIIEEGLAAGCYRPVDAAAAAAQFFATLIGAIEIRQWLKTDPPPDEADKLWQFFLTFLKGH